MLYNPISNYPDSIDPMIFFQDISLTQTEVMDTYNQLILQGKYSEATDYISDQHGIYGYFADYFNAIENRIYHLQEYLLTVEPYRPFVSSEAEPADLDNETIWI